MATFTSFTPAASTQFKHYDPTKPKRTGTKAQARVTEHTLRRDRTNKANYNSGLLHQGIVWSLVM